MLLCFCWLGWLCSGTVLWASSAVKPCSAVMMEVKFALLRRNQCQGTIMSLPTFSGHVWCMSSDPSFSNALAMPKLAMKQCCQDGLGGLRASVIFNNTLNKILVLVVGLVLLNSCLVCNHTEECT